MGLPEPYLPRQRNAPKRYEVGTSVTEVQTSVEAFYCTTYYEVIDYMYKPLAADSIRKDIAKTLSRLEELFCNAQANHVCIEVTLTRITWEHN